MSQVEQSCGEGLDELLCHLDALYGYGMALTRNRTEAEDLAQETYTRAAQHYEGLRRDSNIKAWLFAIMRNLWFKQLRHARSGPEFVAFDDTSMAQWTFDGTVDPEHLCVRIWEREEIRTALDLLPPAAREIIVLCDIEGFSYREMSEMLGCPVGTIMSRLARARGKLKRVLLARQDGSFKRAMPDGS